MDKVKPNSEPETQDAPGTFGGRRPSSCSALADALALIALGPQRSANAIEWTQTSLLMCKHCQGTENVNEAAARIVAEWAERARCVLSEAELLAHRVRNTEISQRCLSVLLDWPNTKISNG